MIADYTDTPDKARTERAAIEAQQAVMRLRACVTHDPQKCPRCAELDRIADDIAENLDIVQYYLRREG